MNDDEKQNDWKALRQKPIGEWKPIDWIYDSDAIELPECDCCCPFENLDSIIVTISE